MANKQDLPNAMSIAEVTERLHLHEIGATGRAWHIQATAAPTGDGLYEGLDWLSEALHQRIMAAGGRRETKPAVADTSSSSTSSSSAFGALLSFFGGGSKTASATIDATDDTMTDATDDTTIDGKSIDTSDATIDVKSTSIEVAKT